jgi:cytochrome P450
MEVLRLRPPAPVSIPHSNTRDDVYNGWVIPKDTVIVMNLFAANLDATRFPDPEKFIPERHMDHVLEDRQIFAQSIEDRPHLTFSTGRRVCVGIYLAEQILFMAASMLVASFKFERTTDELLDMKTPKNVRDATYSPIHYKVRISPRHDGISEFLH